MEEEDDNDEDEEPNTADCPPASIPNCSPVRVEDEEGMTNTVLERIEAGGKQIAA